MNENLQGANFDSSIFQSAKGDIDWSVKTEPIAIIGIGCRFPGAPDPETFWRLLCDGRNVIGEIPSGRLGDLNHLYDPTPATPGKIMSRYGGFLENLDQFDAYFFGISPREAERLDPQQRLLLEVAWESLEDAGQVASRLAGSSTGVFIGSWLQDFEARLIGDPTTDDLRNIDFYTTTGSGRYSLSGRISYSYDFQGPSITVDTACSSSLVAVLLACQSLWRGESEMALAGGVNVILTPYITVAYSQSKMMAPDGQCKFGDARADGYVRSEGCGLVVLKCLSKALADGDSIYAVIRGGAINNDGRSSGFFASPGERGQTHLLRKAYQCARISPGQVQYVEAHGTGTAAGDPVELGALAAVLAVDRPKDRPCLVGAVKTNIGHTEGAAAVAGLIKVALALKHGKIPASLNHEKPNPNIPWDQYCLKIPVELTPWPEHEGPAVAGVSSFGISGTNAHVVVQEAPAIPAAAREATACSDKAQLFVLSAHSSEALKAIVRSYQTVLAAENGGSFPSLQDVCYTASVRRTHHDYRLALVVHNRDELSEKLDAFLREEVRPGMATGRKESDGTRKIVFVFPGQGSQWFGMGRELLEQEPVFRATLEQCDKAMRQHVEWSLLEELTANETRSRLDQVDVIQPTIFSIQVALAALWRSWGIEPDAVVGQSMGEVAAAYVAGALSLRDAARVICRRSRLVKSTSGQGSMAVVGLSLEGAQRALVGYEDRLSVAVSNSPRSTLLSGETAALKEVLDNLERRDIFCRWVKVDYASHSPQMDPLRADLLEALEGLQAQSASVPIYSTVTGAVRDGREFDATYWVRNLREPVLFSTAIQRLLESGHDTFLEISPHPIVLSAIQQGLHHLGREGTVLPSLRCEEEERAVMLESYGALYTLGHPIDWGTLYPSGGRCVPLPSYPWQRKRFWMDTEERTWRSRNNEQNHPLLGHRLQDLAHLPGNHFWQIELHKRFVPYLDNHRVHGVAVLPCTVYIEMALTAAAEVFGTGSHVLEEVAIHKALVLPDDDTRTLQLILTPEGSGKAEASFQIFSLASGAEGEGPSWTLHATGKLRIGQTDVTLMAHEHVSPAEVQTRCREKVPGSAYYQGPRERGIEYGASFQGIEQLWRGDGEALGEIGLPEAMVSEAGVYQIHPALLDSCFQVLAATFSSDGQQAAEGDIYLPMSFESFQVYDRPGTRLWSHALLRKGEGPDFAGDMRLLNGSGQVVAEVRGLRYQPLDREVVRSAMRERLRECLYEIAWQPKERVASEHRRGNQRGLWLIFSDRGGVGAALAGFLERRGETCVRVFPGEAYEMLEEGQFRIDPADPEDLQRLLSEALVTDGAPCRGVVHLWSLDVAPPEKTTLASLETAQLLGCLSGLNLTKALAKCGWSASPRLWLVTRGAQPVGQGPDLIALAQAPLWGLGRVVALEHPEVWGGVIDLDPDASADEASILLAEIWEPDGEDQVAFRRAKRYVARLVQSSDPKARAQPLHWRSDGTYLITGGLGSLGLQVARWMVHQGARHLVLTGRRGLPERSHWENLPRDTDTWKRIAAIRTIEDLGATVTVVQADVSDLSRMSSVLEELRSTQPPLRGIIHAAGVLTNRAVIDMEPNTLLSVLRAKVMGAWVLHQLTEKMALDFFVLFSSAASVWGSKGLAHYAAANHFLDALAHHRHALGPPALSINWGWWAEGGIVTAEAERLFAQIGLDVMPSEQALEALAQLLQERVVQKTVAAVDWSVFKPIYEAKRQRPFLEQIEAQPRLIEDLPSEKRFNLVRRLEEASPIERWQLLLDYVRSEVAKVLGFDPSEPIEPRQGFFKMGMDSIMTVQLRTRLEACLGHSLPPTVAFEYPTIEALARYLAKEVLSLQLSAESRAGSHKDDDRAVAVAEQEQHSEDELTAMLAEKLKQIR